MEEKEPHVGIVADFLFTKALRIYGLPQHAEQLSLKSTETKPYRLYNIDRFAYSDSDPHQSLYGAVPLIYAFSRDQTTGLLWLNSSETLMDFVYNKTCVNTTFFSESGALDFYILSGPTLQSCIKQNAQLTGVVPLPPLFVLGYHQCRFSYMSQDEVTEVSNNFDDNALPLDSLWMDIDYTDAKKYFTWDPESYPDPDGLLKFLENSKRRAVTIIDPHIKVDPEYFVYRQCTKEGFFIKKTNNTVFTAKCWPGLSSWIDFFNPKARQYYANLHKEFANARNLHIWNDMNEPALFETKENSMPKSLIHYGNWKHRDVHNLYGFYQTMATFQGLMLRENLRPFILTRSHFCGSQRFAAIWTGDNVASWTHLKISVPMCLTASLAGFSLCGADIGGFVKHPQDELLQRWYQMGAWLPFFRGHSNRNVPRREPYVYNDDTLGRIRNALEQRYEHLLHWYTLFWKHYTTSEPVIRPLIYQYPHDSKVLDMDTEFLVGEDILVCPVMEAQVDTLDVYLPGSMNETWYYKDRLNNVQKYESEQFCTLLVNMDTVPVFYRAGSIIPTVEKRVKSSAFILDHAITLNIFCDQERNASGTLYVDDMESFDYLKNAYTYIKFTLKNTEITNVELNQKCIYNVSTNIECIKLFGYELDVKNVKLNVGNDDHTITIVKESGFILIKDINVNIQKRFVITLCS